MNKLVNVSYRTSLEEGAIGSKDLMGERVEKGEMDVPRIHHCWKREKRMQQHNLHNRYVQQSQL